MSEERVFDGWDRAVRLLCRGTGALDDDAEHDVDVAIARVHVRTLPLARGVRNSIFSQGIVEAQETRVDVDLVFQANERPRKRWKVS